jgi:hypothetical protein
LICKADLARFEWILVAATTQKRELLAVRGIQLPEVKAVALVWMIRDKPGRPAENRAFESLPPASRAA